MRGVSTSVWVLNSAWCSPVTFRVEWLLLYSYLPNLQQISLMTKPKPWTLGNIVPAYLLWHNTSHYKNSLPLEKRVRESLREAFMGPFGMLTMFRFFAWLVAHNVCFMKTHLAEHLGFVHFSLHVLYILIYTLQKKVKKKCKFWTKKACLHHY